MTNLTEHVLMDTRNYEEACVINTLEQAYDEGMLSEKATQAFLKGDYYEAITIDCLEVEYDASKWYYEDEKVYVGSVMEKLIEGYEKQYHTTISAMVLLASRYSRYGSIGGNGAQGYRVIKGTELIGKNVHWQADDLQIVLENNELHVNTFDHDGTDLSVVVFITENEYNKAVDASYYDYEDILVDLANKKKATRFSNKIIKEITNL